MKIEPFKMRVTPEQSRRVQEVVFENGGKWRSGKTTVINTNYSCLAFDLHGDGDGISGWSAPFTGLPSFSDAELPEITYDEFISKHGKQMKNLKLEVGKTYLTRQEERVKIVGDNGHEMFPFEGDNCLSYTLDGHWDFGRDSVFDLVAEADAQPEKRTFKIPENTREISVNETDGRIVIEFVPEAPKFKEGDVVYEDGRVMIVKAYPSYYHAHTYLKTGRLIIDGGYGLSFTAQTFRLATPAEAQQLFDALAKDGKRWNPDTLKIEELTEVPELTERERIREFFEGRERALPDSLISEIEQYIKEREAQL